MEGEADDVHSGGHVTGDGGVVGVVMKATGRHGRTYVVGDKFIASS